MCVLKPFLVVVLLLTASLVRAQTINADLVFKSSFEDVIPAYGFTWTTDQNVIAFAGRSYEFEVAVSDSAGAISGGSVQWTVETLGAPVTLTLIGTRRVRVTVASNASVVGTIKIKAKYPDSPSFAYAKLHQAQLRPNARFISSAAVLSQTPTSLTLDAAAAGLVGLSPGDVLVSGDLRNVLARVSTLQVQGSSILVNIESAFVDDAFASFGGDLTGEAQKISINIDQGVMTAFDQFGTLLVKQDITRQLQAVSCHDTSGASVTLDLGGMGANWEMTTFIDAPLIRNADGSIEGVQLVTNHTGLVTRRFVAPPLSGRVQLGFECKLDLASIPVPGASVWLAGLARIGLLVGNQIVLNMSVGAGGTATLPSVKTTGNAALRAGVRWTRTGGWDGVSEFDANGDAEISLPANLSGDVSARAKLSFRAQPQLTFSAFGFTAFEAGLVDLDAGVKGEIRLATPFSSNQIAYTGAQLSGAIFLAGKLSESGLGLMLPTLSKLRSGMGPVPLNFRFDLFDVELRSFETPRGQLSVLPTTISPPLSGNLTFTLSGLSANTQGNWRVLAFLEGQDSAFWSSPEIAHSGTTASMQIPANSIVNNGVQASGLLRFHARSRRRFFGLPDPLSDLFPLAAEAAVLATISDGGPPQLSYLPAPGSEVATTYLGDATTANGSIGITPSTGGAGTTTLNSCSITGPGAAAFASVSSISRSFTGSAPQSSSIPFSCTLELGGDALATLSCQERRGSNPAVLRNWPIKCPIFPQRHAFTVIGQQVVEVIRPPTYIGQQTVEVIRPPTYIGEQTVIVIRPQNSP